MIFIKIWLVSNHEPYKVSDIITYTGVNDNIEDRVLSLVRDINPDIKDSDHGWKIIEPFVLPSSKENV